PALIQNTPVLLIAQSPLIHLRLQIGCFPLNPQNFFLLVGHLGPDKGDCVLNVGLLKVPVLDSLGMLSLKLLQCRACLFKLRILFLQFVAERAPFLNELLHL
ncbi:hypothetical protein TcCL_Unassigned07333, partial [Trypanosoma cruzi]